MNQVRSQIRHGLRQRRRYRFFVAMLAAVVVTTCSTRRDAIVLPLDVGYQVTVNRAFQSLPNYTRIYFQQGAQSSYEALDLWTTYCRLHLFNRQHGADYMTGVVPGQFAVTAVKLRYQSSDYPYYGFDSGAFSSISIGLREHNAASGFRRYDGPPDYYLYRVLIKLSSADQPDVQTLTCERKWATRGNYYPKLGEIRQALGDIIEITQPAG